MLKRSFFSLSAASIFSNFSLFLELYYVPASGFDDIDASTSLWDLGLITLLI